MGATGHVLSIEVDPAVADEARRTLAAVGYPPLVVTGDGTRGYLPDAPYDRVISTASVRAVPRAWIDQTRPGGVIVTPWGTDYGDGALTRLWTEVDAAYTWWRGAGRPSPDRCGLTVTPDGAHEVWVDVPHSEGRWSLTL